jgi:hypothetical protein
MGSDTEEKARQSSPCQQGSGEADAESHHRQPQTLRHDETNHINPPRTEREAKSNLARAARDRVGEESVDAHGRERERRGAEQTEQKSIEPRLRQRLRQQTFHGGDVRDREVRVESPDFSAERG